MKLSTESSKMYFIVYDEDFTSTVDYEHGSLTVTQNINNGRFTEKVCVAKVNDEAQVTVAVTETV